MESACKALYVGIDVHSKQHRVAIMPISLLERHGWDWREADTLAIENNLQDFNRLHEAIRERVTSPNEVSIAIDHTGGHFSEPLVYFLQGKGYDLYYLEPKAVKGARRNLLDEETKSDRIDAAGAAYLLYLRDKHGVSFRIAAVTPELGTQAVALRCLVLQRWQFTKLATQATNRVHQLLHAVFPEAESNHFRVLLKVIGEYPTPHDILLSDGLTAVPRLRARDRQAMMRLAEQTVGAPGELYRDLIISMNSLRLEAIAKREELSKAIEKGLCGHPYGRILLSFPYLGEVGAATIIATVKDIDRWPTKNKFKKGLGVYATFKQSGAGRAKARRGKEGNRDARRVLFQVVFSCISPKAPANDFRDHYARQVARGKPKMKALVSTMGKLAEIIYHCLKSGELYQYQGKYRSGHRSNLKGLISTARHSGGIP